jgi:protein-disulfide isomerase
MILTQNNQLAKSLGLTSTPTSLLITEGKDPVGIVGAQPYHSFQEALSQLQKS